MACVPSKDSDQPGHPPSLIGVFTVRVKKPWALGYSESAQRRLRSAWADAQADLSLCWAYISFCWFCHEVAHLSFLFYFASVKVVTLWPLEHILLILILFVMPASASCDIGVHLSIHISASMNMKPLAVTNHKIYSSYLVYFRWASSSEFGTYRLIAFAQSRQNLRCSLIQAMSQEDPSDRKPDPWPL